jgi:hypothetical protein
VGGGGTRAHHGMTGPMRTEPNRVQLAFIVSSLHRGTGTPLKIRMGDERRGSYS